MVRDRPYSQVRTRGGRILRTFSGTDISESELRWHRDARDRDVLFVSGEGWSLQVEGGLPTPISPMSRASIPRGVWHRLISEGVDDLVVLITEK